MLKERFLTALVALPLLLSLLIFGPEPIVTFFFLCFVGLSVYEAAGMTLYALERRILPNAEIAKEMEEWHYWRLFCVAIGIGLFIVSTFGDYDTGRGGIVLGMSLLSLVGIFSSRSIDRSIVRVMGFIVSVCYGALPWLAIWDLYLMGDHARYILLVLAIVMFNDTGAYFGGRSFGKRKLSPRLSPKKTWEGAVSGVFSGIVAALLVNMLFSSEMGPWWLMILVAVFGGSFGVMGDLVESAFKRFAEIKDSGAILPGHGGFLDRVDSLLFAAPVIWFILYSYSVMSL